MMSVECSLQGDHVVVNETASFDDSVTEEEELSWRLPPDESLSDYIIEVRCRDSCHFVTYHVHKSILAVGPRRSHYFVCHFFQKTKQSAARITDMATDAAFEAAVGLAVQAETCGGTELQRSLEMQHMAITQGRDRTVLEMEDLAAQAFPVLLDYMYSSAGRLAINTGNATPLAWLAQHLEVKSLKREVKDFWMNDLCMKNLDVYYEHSILFQNEKVLMYANDYCADHIFTVEEAIVVKVLTTIDPYFLMQVMTKVHGKVSSRRLSLLIAVYCNVHRDALDPPIFLQLTADHHIPTLEVKAAKVLLELEANICRNKDKMSSLKKRCIAVLAQHWDDTCIIKDSSATATATSTEEEQKTDVSSSATAPFKSVATGTASRASPSSLPIPLQRVSLPCLAGSPLELFVKLSFLNSKTRLDNLDRVRRERDALQDECESLRQQMQRMTAQLQLQRQGDQQDYPESRDGVNVHLLRSSMGVGTAMNNIFLAGSGDVDFVNLSNSSGGIMSSLLTRDESPDSQCSDCDALPTKE